MRAPLKRIQKAACSALIAFSFLAASGVHADWSNFGTVSMTDAVTPKLTNGYLCYSDGRDIACNTSVGPVLVGTSGMINNGGMTVAGSVSASAVSATYVSATVLQINPSTMPCSTGLNGTIRYSSVSSTLEVCVGTSWTTLSSNTAPGNLSGTGSATAVAFWSGPSSLTYESSTTSGLYWDSANGRLGVGTNSPVVGLTISSTSGLAFDSAAAKSISWYTGGGYPVQIRGDASNIYLAFLLGGREAARFNTAGNLGLGTQSPTATLQVSGTFTVSNSQAPTSPSFVVGLNGNVGIGVANPMQQNGLHLSDALGYGFIGSPNDMHLEGNAYYDGTNWRYMVAKPAMMMAIGPGTNGASFWSAPAGTANAVISFPTTPTLRINPSGSVAVGTYANTSSFTVVGEVQVSSSGGPCATATNGGAIRYSAGTLSYCNGADTWTALAASGVTNPGGATTNVQYNNNGALGGDANFTYVSSTGSVSVSGALYTHDANAYFYNNGTTPALVFDTNDYLQYIRATNTLGMYIGGIQLVSLSSAGYMDVAGRVSSTLFYGGDGTVGAPTYSFSNDTNSGLYRPSSNVIGVSIGSAEVARFTAGGLSLPGTVSASSVSATNVSGTNIQVGQSTLACAAGVNGAIRYNTTSNTLQICVGTTWTSLASGTTGGTLTGGGSATAVAFWNGPSSLTYESTTTSGLYWDQANKQMGIGINAPTASLHVSDSKARIMLETVSSTNYSAMTFKTPGNLRWQVGMGGPGVTDGVNGKFFIYDFGVLTYRMVVDTNGNVGIGTNLTTPTATFQVSGTFTVSNSAQGATSPSIFVSATNGYVGIGTMSPDVPLTVAGATSGSLLHLIRTNSSFNSNIRYESGAGSLYAGAYGLDFRIGMNSDLGISPVAVFTPSNSVGIGTGNGAVPSSLTVVGEAQVGSSGAACVAATNGGAIRYSAGALYYCNGANTWATIGTGGGTLTGGGSATAIAFWNGASSLTYESATTSSLYWDHGNGRLGIGTNTPNEALDVSTTQGRAFFGATVTGGRAGLLINGYSPGGPYARLESYNYGISSGIPLLINAVGNGPVGVGALSPTAALQVSGTFTVSQSWQNTASAASMLVDSRGVSVSSIVHINGSAFSPIGAGGNAILSGTTAVSTSSAGSITMYTGGNLAFAVNNNGRVGIKQEPNSFPLAVSGTIFTGRNNTTIEGGEIDLAYPENNGSTNNSMWITDVYGSASSPSYRIFNKSSAGTVVNAVTINNDGTVWVGAASSYPSTQISPNGGIGFNTNASANGYWYAGFYRSGTAIGSISQNGTTAIAYNTTSDRRVKEDITDTREGLQKLMELPVRDFAFRADPSHTIVTGFIAQELEKVFPEAVTTNGDNGESPLKDKSKPWSVDYGRVTPLIVKAVQELKAANDNLANETAALKSENAALKSANDNMARRLDVLERKVGLQP